MNKRVIIITSAGLIIGIAEALLFYNLGKQKEGKGFSYSFPPGKEFGKIIAFALGTAILTTALSYGLEKLVTKEDVGDATSLAIAK